MRLKNQAEHYNQSTLIFSFIILSDPDQPNPGPNLIKVKQSAWIWIFIFNFFINKLRSPYVKENCYIFLLKCESLFMIDSFKKI